MPRIDDACDAGVQIYAHELAGHEAAGVRRVRRQSLLCRAGLLREPDTGTTPVPQRAYQHRREQCRVERVSHRVGHRQMQGVALEAEVEGVAAHIAGRLQPAGKRELSALAGVGAGQQPVLDLGLQ